MATYNGKVTCTLKNKEFTKKKRKEEQKRNWKNEKLHCALVAQCYSAGPSPPRPFPPPLYREEAVPVRGVHPRPPWPRLSPCRSSTGTPRCIKPSPMHQTNPRPTIHPSCSPLSFSSSSERVVAATSSTPRPPDSPRRCNKSRSFAVFDYVLYAPPFELEGTTSPGSTSSTSFGRRCSSPNPATPCCS